MIIQISKEVYDNLSDSEQQVIKYLNENEASIPLMSITTIAEKTFTSPATVSRTIQKCGFRSISELRYKINKQAEHTDDSYVVNKVLNKSYKECVKTIDNICITSILKVIEYIKEADKIFIYARGFSALVADELCMQLHLLGYNAQVVKDVVWMVKTDKLVNNRDLVIILSVMNTTPELASSAKMAKKSGAKVVTCCCKEGTPLERYSDVSIIGYAETITSNKTITVISRIPLYIIIRTIVEYLTL
ncbi:MurR/RpiR family transcriptional regulator [[Clostridium] innocuum]|nr:MurR/RpiR family transcriptional regulator [[Clostridium] innocuum]